MSHNEMSHTATSLTLLIFLGIKSLFIIEVDICYGVHCLNNATSEPYELKSAKSEFRLYINNATA